MIRNNKPFLLDMFEEYLKSSWEGSLRIPTIAVPLECQVIESKPDFIVSDTVHSVECEFTKSAVECFTKEFPLIKIKDLDGCLVSLLLYVPISEYTLTSGLNLRIRVHKFTMTKALDSRKTIIGKPTPLNKSSELKPYERLVKSKYYSDYVKQVEKSQHFPDLEAILLKNAKLTSPIEPTLKVKPKEIKEEEEITEKFSEFMEDEVIPYKYVGKYRKALIEEIKASRRSKRVSSHKKHEEEEGKSADPTVDTVSDLTTVEKETVIKKENTSPLVFINEETLSKYLVWKSRGMPKDTNTDLVQIMDELRIPCIKLAAREIETSAHNFQKRTATQLTGGEKEVDTKRSKKMS